jgi:hypothetical protein
MRTLWPLYAVFLVSYDRCNGAWGCNLLLYNKKENEVFHYLLTADSALTLAARPLTDLEGLQEEEEERESEFGA